MKELSRFRTVQLASNGDFLDEHHQIAVLTGCTFFSLSLHSLQMPWHTEAIKFLHIARAKGLETQVSILEGLVPAKTKKRFIHEWQKHVNRVRIYQEHSIDGFGDMNGLSKPTEPCTKPFEETVVYWDGKVGLCNHDWDNRTWLGDLNTESLADVWQNSNYSHVRNLHESGKRGFVPSCRECCFGNKLYGELYG